MEMRLALLFVIGVLVGRQVNRGIYRLAWFARALGPWSPPPVDAPAVASWIGCLCWVGGSCAASRRGMAPATGFVPC